MGLIPTPPTLRGPEHPGAPQDLREPSGSLSGALWEAGSLHLDDLGVGPAGAPRENPRESLGVPMVLFLAPPIPGRLWGTVSMAK